MNGVKGMMKFQDSYLKAVSLWERFTPDRGGPDLRSSFPLVPMEACSLEMVGEILF